ncbi:MAG: colicin import membrane protein [Candidatus Azotimanducaceae bacterium]|jgi:colicin import membrane protein
MAVLVHGAVLGLLLYQWPEDEAPPAAAIEHFYIDAALVTANPHKVKQRQADAARQQRTKRVKARGRRDAKARQARLEADKAVLYEAEVLRQTQELANQVKAASTIDAAEQERQQMEQSLARAISAEQDARRAVTDDEKAMAYVSQIQREIIQHWSRPPSARNGMQALLKVYLVPTGEVVKVDLVTSSGNDAFDRSAISAVQKAERFIVPPNANQFERNFREFEVLFRPEDLRL